MMRQWSVILTSGKESFLSCLNSISPGSVIILTRGMMIVHCRWREQIELDREGFLPDFPFPRPGQAVQLLQHLLQLHLWLRWHEHCHCSHPWQAGKASHLSEGEHCFHSRNTFTFLLGLYKKSLHSRKGHPLACLITISGLSPLFTSCSNTATSSSNRAPVEKISPSFPGFN